MHPWGAIGQVANGAHAPGLLDEPVPVGAALWVGNQHKRAFSTRTAAALHLAPAWRDRVRPLVASAGAPRGYPLCFDDLGTQGPTAYLSLPTALTFPRDHLGLDSAGLRARDQASRTRASPSCGVDSARAPARTRGSPCA